MQINNNCLKVYQKIQNKQQQNKTSSWQQINFGKVIGQRDNLFNAIGMERMGIVDTISDEAGLDVFINREYERDGAFCDYGYIIPANSNLEIEKYKFQTCPLKGDVGWFIPKKSHPKTVKDVLNRKDCITILKACCPSLGAGRGFGYRCHELSFYFNIMHQLCERSAEKKIIETVEKRTFDFSNPQDAYQSIYLPLYTQTPLIKAFDSNKSENRKNIKNIVNASVDTFRRIINQIATYEVYLQTSGKTENEKIRWVRWNKKRLYPPYLFNDREYNAGTKK